MVLNSAERKTFILNSMAHMAGGVMSNLQTVDNARRAFGDAAEAKLAEGIYNIAVTLADKYDSENP